MMNIYRKIRKIAWRASMKGLARGPHITRYYMYDRLRSISSKLPNKNGRVLSISHSENLADLVGLEPSEIVSADYPEHNLLSLAFENESFDYVLSNQVLEHIEGNPQQAIDESYRVLRPGGIAIHTTCFIIPVHGAPKISGVSRRRRYHCYIRIGARSSKLVVGAIFRFGLLSRMVFAPTGVPHAHWHPLHKLAVKNDPLWPIVTWIAAKK